MQAYIELFEFLAEFVDVQIKKYSALAQFGVGPDAGPNALLVANQVKVLLQVAHNLNKAMQDFNSGIKPSESILHDAYNHIYFYTQMEYLRAYAGWLMDKNNIHTPVYERVAEQKNALKTIAEKFDLHFDTNFIKTHSQQQCEYDSYAIACKILTFAIELKQNPQMEFPAGTSDHVQKILRGHIATPTSRYNQEEIWTQIQDLHKPCKEYLDTHPHVTQTTEVLSHSDAQLLATGHKKQLNEFLSHFKENYLNSILFSPNHKWHKITYEEHNPSVDRTPATLLTFSRNRYVLYAGMTATAAAVSMFIYNLIYNSEGNEEATPSPLLTFRNLG